MFYNFSKEIGSIGYHKLGMENFHNFSIFQIFPEAFRKYWKHWTFFLNIFGSKLPVKLFGNLKLAVGTENIENIDNIAKF